MECEECGRTDKPLLVFVFSLKDNSDPNKLHTDSLYLCQECLDDPETHSFYKKKI